MGTYPSPKQLDCRHVHYPEATKCPRYNAAILACAGASLWKQAFKSCPGPGIYLEGQGT